MLIHYLKIIFRGIVKDKKYSVMNILGLSIAIACCFLLIFWVKFELSYENCFPHADRIYQVVMLEKRPDGVHPNAIIRPCISDVLKEDFPQISASTFTHVETLPFAEAGKEGDGIMVDKMTVSSDFVRMFAFEYIEGNPQIVEKEHGCIMTDETARKFFGNESALGKTIVFGNSFLSLTVKAVVKRPINSEIQFDILNLAKNTDFISYGQHYIMLEKGANHPEKLQKQLTDYFSKSRDTENKLGLLPFKKVHLYSGEGTNRLNQIYLFSLAAFLILLIAVINYINTSIARALNRMKEVGVRKVTGANKRQLIERFLFESFILSTLSVGIAFFFVKLFFPEFSGIMGNKITLTFDFFTFIIGFVVCLITTILSGGYAAFYLSSFNPVSVLGGGSKTGSKDRFRKVLIGFQFFLSISILICTTVIYMQIHTIFHADTGVDRKHILILESGLWYDAESFIEVIKKENPHVIDASIALGAPYNAQYGYSGVSWEGSSEAVKVMEFAEISCDSHYAHTFGLKVVEGEFIPPGLSWWQNSEANSFNIVINANQ